jgi:hypothetical protein
MLVAETDRRPSYYSDASYRQYVALDPRLTPPDASPQLEAVLSSPVQFDDSSRHYIGAMSVELAVASEGEAAERWADAALYCLEPLVTDSKHRGRAATAARLLRVLSAAGISPEGEAAHDMYPRLSEAHKLYATASTEAARSAALGTLREEVVEALIMRMTDAGIAIYGSFDRQEARTSGVDGENYNWDLTAESNGTVLPAGTWRVQIKGRREDGYHRDIHVLPVATLTAALGGEACVAQAILKNRGGPIRQAQAAVLQAFASRQPATVQTPMLDRTRPFAAVPTLFAR